MATFFLAFTLQCLFPIFDLNPNEFLGISLVNTDTQDREFTITVTSSNGTDVGSGRLTIPAGAQRARLIREILGMSAEPVSGSVRADAVGSLCSSYLVSGNDRSLQGSEPAATFGNAILLPRVDVNTGFMELNHVDTSVAIVNPNSSAGNVTANLFGLDGALRGSAAIPISARGSHTFRISDLFGNVLPANSVAGKTFQGYLRLNSDIGIAAWQRITTPLASNILRGRNLSELSTTSVAVFPHFVFSGDYGSTLNLINPTNAILILDVSAHDDRGNAIGDVVRVTLAPGASRRSSVGEFFRLILVQIFPPPTITGYIRIREAQGQSFQVAGDIEIIRTIQGAPNASMLVWVSDTPSLRWTVPFASSTGPYFTGYAIVNPNELLTVQTDVTVEFLGSNGGVLQQSTISLSPANRRASLVPEGFNSGFVRIQANMPVFALGSIGTRNGDMLEQLPPLR
jgi:hypothetical protein